MSHVKPAAVAPLLIVAIATLLLPGCGPAMHAARSKALTTARLSESKQKIEQHFEQEQSLPDDAAGQSLIEGGKDVQGYVQYRRVSETSFELRAAGPDTTLGNDDDTTMMFEVQGGKIRRAQ